MALTKGRGFPNLKTFLVRDMLADSLSSLSFRSAYLAPLAAMNGTMNLRKY